MQVLNHKIGNITRSAARDWDVMLSTRHHVEILIGQDIWRKIQEVHPTLAGCGRFIDWKSYRLGPLQSELRTKYKKSAFE
jgi:hypothetical protein